MIDKRALGVGVFMYTPAILNGVEEKLDKWCDLDSICLDFEDGLAERDLAMAERGIAPLLERIQVKNDRGINVFIRVRNPSQFKTIAPIIPKELVTGYVFPKVTTSNFLRYYETYAKYAAAESGFIPILETEEIADTGTRFSELIGLYRQFKEVETHLICLQFGAADLCRIYRLRRPLGFTVYDIQVLVSIIADILSIFLRDFAITGSVYEYFTGDFAETLRKETMLDRLNGFTGKLAIHPNQLPIIKEALQIPADELAEAKQLVESDLSVEKSLSGRMNERNTHLGWAEKLLALHDALSGRK